MRLRVCAALIALATCGACGVACGGAKTHAANPGPSDTTAEVDSGAPDAAVADESPDAGVVASAEPVDAGPPTHPPVDIRGKCVDPIADAKVRAKWPKNADLAAAPTRIDLDGDGVEDWIITTAASDAAEMSGYVYITRKNCGIYALSWKGTEPTTAATSTQGFLDLQVASACKVNCCPVTNVLVYKWNGRVYAKAGAHTATRNCLGMRHP